VPLNEADSLSHEVSKMLASFIQKLGSREEKLAARS
jgi:hypothetical protein